MKWIPTTTAVQSYAIHVADRYCHFSSQVPFPGSFRECFFAVSWGRRSFNWERHQRKNESQGFTEEVSARRITVFVEWRPGLPQNVELSKLARFNASLATHKYPKKDGRMRELFFHIVPKMNLSWTSLNGAELLQLVFDNSPVKAKMPYEKR